MNSDQIYNRGSVSGIFLIVVVVAVALFAGYWWGANKGGSITETISDISERLTATSSTPSTATSSTDTNTENKTTATKETVAPKKPFGKLYTDPNNDFSFRYPENYVYEKEPLVPGEMGGYALRFYESGANKESVTKSFVITKRHLDTFQVTVGMEDYATGCVYNTTTHALKIASSYEGKTVCDNVSIIKNNNGVRYFNDFTGSIGSVSTLDSEIFISEKKNIVVTLEIASDDTGSIPASIKDLVVQSFIFK